MALNLKESLEIVKRAGFGPDTIMNSGKTERRMVDGQRIAEEESRPAEERDELAELLEQIDFHRDPEKMTADQLLNIEDL